jgi:hypothetical protein
MIGYKSLSKLEKSLNGMIKPKENFENNNKVNIENKCKVIQDNYNKMLSTPVAVNIPQSEFENKFYIGENKYSNPSVSPEPNSFPIKQLKYDGICNGEKINKNDFQKINWNNSTTLDSNLHYDINKLINVPEKNIGIGYDIVSLYDWNNINNYNDKLVNINTQKDFDCDNSNYDNIYVI